MTDLTIGDGHISVKELRTDRKSLPKHDIRVISLRDIPSLGPKQSIVQSLELALGNLDTKVGSLLLTTNLHFAL